MNNFYIFLSRHKLMFTLSFAIPIFVYTIISNLAILYVDMLIGEIVTLMIAFNRYLNKNKPLDIELAIALTLADMIFRFFLPPFVTTVTNFFIFTFMLIFLYRQLKLPIGENWLFLIAYSVFYFALTLKYLALYRAGIVIETLYSILLSVTFAYSLLGTSKTNNFYRCTFCGAMALLCLIVLGKRLSVDTMNNMFFIAHVSVLLFMFISFIYWYEGKEFFMGLVYPRVFFNVSILPHLISGLSFLYYISGNNVKDSTAVWGLVGTLSLWYIISIISGLQQIFDYPQEAMACENLTPKALDRLEKYVAHLRESNRLKK